MTAGAVGITIGIFFGLIHLQNLVPISVPSESEAGIDTENNASLAAASAAVSSAPATTSTPSPAQVPTSTPAKKTKKNASSAEIKRNATQNAPENKASAAPAAKKEEVQDPMTITRIENPYPFPPESFAIINEKARLALVNIICAAKGGSLKSTSGSGIIIDPRGVILTNAHVAQYVLLSADKRVDLLCIIRTGSPAREKWFAEVVYVPPVWVREHASEISSSRTVSTGEHDYALLRIIGTFDGSQVPGSFPYLPIDTREAIGFLDDPVLVASYPAEFIGGITSQFNLYPASSVTTIQDLLTFDLNTVDVISLGGVIVAQSGSSGGSITNAWGHAIGVISTTSEGTTTAQRDLRAITLGYINRDILAQNGSDLDTILSGDIESRAKDFNANQAPALLELLISNIAGRRN